MGTEIERKFLVEKLPDRLVFDSEDEIAQGYLATGDAEVRLRWRGDWHFITAKRGHGLEREEVEVPIDRECFNALWPLTEGLQVEKTRRTTQVAGGTLEVDTYHGALDGLVTAEIEFADIAAAQAFRPPAWLGRELTGEERYSNQHLAQEGLPDEAR